MKPLLPLAIAAFTVLFGLPAHATAVYHYERAEGPARTLVVDAAGATVATLTDGARTAVFRGPTRTFDEPAATTATVTTRDRVLLAPRPWHAGGETDGDLRAWLANTLAGSAPDRGPDVLDIAMQYRRDTPDLVNANGIRYAGRAFFGPVVAGERITGSDFVDYLGVPWTYDDGVTQEPDPLHQDSLDCSGFLRMVFGYRSGYPVGRTPGPGVLPRTVSDFATAGPGTVVVPDTGTAPSTAQLATLLPGDVLLFDLDPEDGPLLDHSGLYLGLDSAGQPRFISSRKVHNAPTMGDRNGSSVLTGSGVFARVLREVRRL
ncbi:hypothetical protein [Umezawaea sp. NPDC059074]|uniref:hypothetical protein n=1 Tax=Umezawaea sp. NPDC059074 TaxID=3346716 RepID=UPI0036B1BBB6